MRAVVYDGFGQPPEIREVPEPEPAPDGVVIAVAVTGLCRSDWHGWQGHDPDIRRFPHVPGHEFVGTIAAVGPDVTGRRVGDRVTVPFVCACGSCEPCSDGQPQICAQQTQPGFTHWGAFADYVAIEHADLNVVRLPAELSDDSVAALGCRFGTAFRAVRDRARVRESDWVAVYGCGGLGLSAVMIATAFGARVVAVDRSPAALSLAAELGAAATIEVSNTYAEAGLPGGPDTVGGDGNLIDHGAVIDHGTVIDHDAEVAAAVREVTGGGADVGLECAGHAGLATTSVHALRRGGCHVQVGLLPPRLGIPKLPMDRVIAHELRIYGSHGIGAADYPALLDLVENGALRPERLVRRHVRFADVPRALMDMATSDDPGITLWVNDRAITAA